MQGHSHHVEAMLGDEGVRRRRLLCLWEMRVPSCVGVIREDVSPGSHLDTSVRTVHQCQVRRAGHHQVRPGSSWWSSITSRTGREEVLRPVRLVMELQRDFQRHGISGDGGGGCTSTT